MSDSVWPRRRQPTRLPRPWDSPGKNTGVGCHFLLQCMKEKSESEVAQSCLTLSDPMDHSPPGSSIHGIFQARVLEWSASGGRGHINCWSTKTQVESFPVLYKTISTQPHQLTDIKLTDIIWGFLVTSRLLWLALFRNISNYLLFCLWRYIFTCTLVSRNKLLAFNWCLNSKS